LNEFLFCASSECLGLIKIKKNVDLPPKGVRCLTNQLDQVVVGFAKHVPNPLDLLSMRFI